MERRAPRVTKVRTKTSIPAPALAAASRKDAGSPALVFLLVILVVGGALFGWWKMRQIRNRRAPEPVTVTETPPPPPPEEKKAEAVKPPPPAEEPVTVTKPVKTLLDIWREDQTAYKTAAAQVEAARAESPVTLTRFRGVRFGEPVSGVPFRWGTVYEGDSVESSGVACAVWGPEGKTGPGTLGARPLVWVTPKTHRAWRVEYSRKLKLAPGSSHDPETKKLVATFIKDKLKKDAIVTKPAREGRPGCEYVYPVGQATIRIGEYDGMLKLIVDHEGVRREAKAESDTLRRMGKEESADAKLLDSARYPQGDFANFTGTRFRFKDETPRSFCGLFFGKTAPESATIVTPQKGAKGFFLNYQRAKCPPFRGFNRGRADVDPLRGGVYAVRLASEGGTDGLDDRDYYDSVKKTISSHYKSEPTVQKGPVEDFDDLTWTIGDLVVTFGADPCGGFYLSAENKVLSKIAGVVSARAVAAGGPSSSGSVSAPFVPSSAAASAVSDTPASKEAAPAWPSESSPSARGVRRVDPSRAAWCVLYKRTPVSTTEGKSLGSVKGGRFFRIEKISESDRGEVVLVGNFTPKKLPTTVQIPANNAFCFSGDPESLSETQRTCLRNFYEIRGEAEAFKEKSVEEIARRSPYAGDAAEALRKLRALAQTAERQGATSEAARKAAYEISRQKTRIQELNEKHKQWKADHAAEFPDPAEDPVYKELMRKLSRYQAPISEIAFR